MAVSSLSGIDLRSRAGVRGPVAVPTTAGWRASSSGDLRADVREEARAEGFAAGWAEGRRVAAAEAEDRVMAEQAALAEQLAFAQASVEAAVTALGAAAADLEQRSVAPLAEITDVVIAAAISLAEAIIGRELAVASEPGADALRRALDLAPGHRPITVRMNPADLVALGPSGTSLELDGRTVTLLADGALAAGDAVADCGATHVDARIGAALDRAREVLGL
jgi:flagellar assembly protein FliH